ncbi:HsdM family class I SAM-dependent methyltransferase [Virgibacillus senegalensis]|uniref:HsdM family class I SAM-dependent methyltransferase n=1 Tax=Virgibacillus senegalensis TaxID=1499679 RepID=UPI00069CD8E1|nr:SAM-dependent methyltransferase [Virgibacillus senegalensis]
MSNSQEIINHYYRQVAADKRKKLGQYFTPDSIARIMKAWVTGNHACRQIVDPAVGLGELITGLPEQLSVLGYDIDRQILDFARHRLQIEGITAELIQKDFLKHGWSERYQGIICNPPYIRFKHYEEKQEYLRLVEEHLGIKLSGFTNMYALFLLKAIYQLKQDGRAAFIVPSDFLNADYGAVIKQFILQQQNLPIIAVTDFTMNWFDQAATTSALFFFDNSRQTSEIEFIPIKSQEELAELQTYVEHYGQRNPIGRILSHKDLDVYAKWRRYYQPANESPYRHLRPLADFTRVTRGIATGDNKFFCVSESTRKNWKLDRDHFLPCLSKSNQANKHFFFSQDYQSLVEKGSPVFLLNIEESSPQNEHVQAYLKHGEETGSSDRYLTKRRKPWYKNETRLPPDIFISTFSRGKVKFIRNEAGARSLTCFHCLYIHPQYREKLDLLMAYFMTNISQEVIEQSQRQYGNGLKKLEPNDIKQTMAVDLDAITDKEAEEIRKIYQEIRKNHLHDPESGHENSILKLDSLFERILLKE